MPSDTPAGGATIPPAFVKLNDPYFQNSLWSNDAADMQLDAYFHPQKPNLGSDFGIAGLKPVIRRLRDDQYLLTDSLGRFYVWQPDEGNMWRIEKEGLEVKDAADMVMNGIADSQLVKVFRPNI